MAAPAQKTLGPRLRSWGATASLAEPRSSRAALTQNRENSVEGTDGEAASAAHRDNIPERPEEIECAVGLTVKKNPSRSFSSTNLPTCFERAHATTRDRGEKPETTGCLRIPEASSADADTNDAKLTREMMFPQDNTAPGCVQEVTKLTRHAHLLKQNLTNIHSCTRVQKESQQLNSLLTLGQAASFT